jgi:hypothetical protein
MSACMTGKDSAPCSLVPDLWSESARLEACRSTFAGSRFMALRAHKEKQQMSDF